MRTTVTLDPDTESLLRKRMTERQVSMKQALNDAVRAGLGATPRPAAPFRSPAFELGMPSVPLDRALQLAGELEDEEIIRKARAGK